ncbi:hypothetical protein G6F66_014847 [Rhizopus arrhizus]|nr:hypothetical protein G6F66_014847 [Rhizopus arrhizus]
MVRHAEGQREGGLVGVFPQQAIQLVEHVFVRRAPGAHEGREKALHVVEVRFAAIDEARMVAVAAQQVGQREEAALRAGQFQHGLRGGGQKTRDHRF